MRGEARATETVPSRVPDAELPIYAILVPLYREAHMLAPLVHGLSHLDWPAAKLDIKLILEAVDPRHDRCGARARFSAMWRSSWCPSFIRAPSRRR